MLSLGEIFSFTYEPFLFSISASLWKTELFYCYFHMNQNALEQPFSMLGLEYHSPEYSDVLFHPS